MITKVIVTKDGEVAVDNKGLVRPIATLYGLSTDTKPTTGVENADRFLEMDTKKMHLFDGAGKTWLPF